MGQRVLVTRPEPGATATANRLRAMGFEPVSSPLLSVRLRQGPRFPDLGRVQAVLVTSGQAIPALPKRFAFLPLFAVGDATANRARAAGFEEVESASGDAESLARLVARRCAPSGKPLLMVCGRGQGTALAALLRDAGFKVDRRVVYFAQPVARLPAASAVALSAGTLTAALFFSAQTAAVFTRLVQRATLSSSVRNLSALAISPRAAEPLNPLPFRQIRVAIKPSETALLELLK